MKISDTTGTGHHIYCAKRIIRITSTLKPCHPQLNKAKQQGMLNQSHQLQPYTESNNVNPNLSNTSNEVMSFTTNFNNHLKPERKQIGNSQLESNTAIIPY